MKESSKYAENNSVNNKVEKSYEWQKSKLKWQWGIGKHIVGASFIVLKGHCISHLSDNIEMFIRENNKNFNILSHTA